MPRLLRRPLAAVFLVALLAGCASAGPSVDDLLPADVILVGEQHDDPGHQQRHRDLVQSLAVRDRLAAVAIEMADQGTSTAGLPRDADDSTVRASLRWDETAWPWQAYAPALLAAVRAGVPVLGANLPREGIRAAMQDTTLDTRLDSASLQAQREAVRVGHCDLLPAAQLAPMARVQIARDRMMARTIVAAAVPGQTVLLLAGAGHVDRELGVPRHLPPGLLVRSLPLAPTGAAPATDHCAELRKQWQGRPPAS